MICVYKMVRALISETTYIIEKSMVYFLYVLQLSKTIFVIMTSQFHTDLQKSLIHIINNVVSLIILHGISKF